MTRLAKLGTLLALLAVVGMGHAALIGEDNAAAAAYDDGWTTGDDGTSGGDPGAFGQWFLGGDGSHSIGDSTQVAGGAGGDINSAGESFRMQAPNGTYADAYRFLDPAGLSVGQTFSIDMAVNFRGGFKGIDLRGPEPDNNTLFNFNIGGDDYVVDQAETGNGSIGNAYSNNTVFRLEFTQTSATGGTWAITRSGGVADYDTGTYTGVARSIKLYIGGMGTAQEDDLFVNNLAIVPEPASQSLLALAGLLLAGRRRA